MSDCHRAATASACSLRTLLGPAPKRPSEGLRASGMVMFDAMRPAYEAGGTSRTGPVMSFRQVKHLALEQSELDTQMAYEGLTSRSQPSTSSGLRVPGPT